MIALPLLLAAAAATVPGDCRDNRGVDRCDVKQQSAVRELFGAKTIEDHARAGSQVRRVFYVDGYGRDVIAIEFIRAAGADPAAIVRFPDAKSKEPRQPLTAPVPPVVWDDVLRSSEHFDRELVGDVQRAGNDLRLCLHSWVYTAESGDPAEEGRPAEIRRRTEDACNDGLTESFAWKLASATVKLLPACDLLDRRNYRNEAALLSSCGILAGDRFAAATVLNSVEGVRHALDEGNAPGLGELFDYRAQINWAGEKFSGEDAGKFWAQRALGQDGRTDIYLDRVVGESAKRVRLRGTLYRSLKGAGYAEADVELIWQIPGRYAEISEATVGPFRPAKP